MKTFPRFRVLIFCVAFILQGVSVGYAYVYGNSHAALIAIVAVLMMLAYGILESDLRWRLHWERMRLRALALSWVEESDEPSLREASNSFLMKTVAKELNDYLDEFEKDV